MDIGKLTAVFDADTRKFDAGARGVQSKLALIKTEMINVTTTANPTSSALSAVSRNLGVLAGASVIAVSAISSLAVGLFELVKSASAAGGELFDLSQKTNFTVETLSGLSIVAKTTGSDIKSLSASLGIFQKNMEAAGDSSSKQGKLFQSLNIDIHDNEKALRQAFTQLNKMSDGAHQTAVAMQLFGRSGKDVLAIVKETNGNLDAAIQKYDKMGLIISHGAAAASDKFNDVLEETTLQLSAVTRSIGMELLPVATEALQTISFWLAENKGAWSSWGTTISDVIRGVASIANSEIGSIISMVARLSAEITGLPGIVRGLGGIGASERPMEDAFGPGGAMRGGRKTLGGTSEFMAAQRRLAGLGRSGGGGGGGGGRGGGGGGRKAKARATGGDDFDEYYNLFDYLKRVEEDRVQKNKQIADEMDRQKDRLNDMVLSALELSQGFSEFGPVSTATGALEKFMEKEPPEISKQSQAILDMREQVREAMMELGSDLTSVFSRAVGDGFEQGAKRGLQSLALGLLDIVQNILLKNIAEGLGGILSGIGTGGKSGGSWWKTLLGIGTSAIAGGVGGGGGSGGGAPLWVGGWAKGGVVPGDYKGYDSVPAMLSPGETVIPRGGKAGGGNTFNIQLPRMPHGSRESARSRRQQAEALVAALQGAQR